MLKELIIGLLLLIAIFWAIGILMRFFYIAIILVVAYFIGKLLLKRIKEVRTHGKSFESFG